MDETKMVEALVGPYAGKRLTMPAADADQAIADGWARDPFAPRPEDEPLMSEKKRLKALEAAEAAGRKLRGEDEPDAAAEAQERDLRPNDPGGGYETRRAAPTPTRARR